jgi:hypothetical protein
VKNIWNLSFFLVFFISYSQQGSNIYLDEVVNSAKEIPKIYINDKVYSFRERDTLIKKLLRSAFWKDFQFKIPLEDYETGNKYLFESEGSTRVYINNIELTKNHLFKTYLKIRNLSKKIKKVEIRTHRKEANNTKSTAHKERIIAPLQNTTGAIVYDAIISSPTALNTKELAVVTHIKITAHMNPKTLYNRTSYRKKIRAIELEQAGSIALEGVEVVKNIKKDGIVYSPIYIDGQLSFQEDVKLTELARKAKRFKQMGLNEWGIDVNTDSWALALRAHFKGPISRNGLPILVPTFSVLNQALPLWVVDGTALSEPPQNVRGLTPFIREVKILKNSEASFYGSRGAAGVIILNTSIGYEADLNVKKSFNVKGKKNRDLMMEFQKFESQFKLKLEQLNSEKKDALENNDIIRIDSLQRLLDKTLLKSYLYTANFALVNSNYEIAPYLAFTKISDAHISLLDSIAKKLSHKVKKSRYGKKFIAFLESRKEF